MQCYLTPDETAQHLKVEVTEILSLIEQGKLRAIRIGDSIRIPETELERLPVTCAAGPTAAAPPSDSPATQTLPDNSRWCHTRKGVKFRVSGSVTTGAQIWPGKMRYPIKFPKSFMDAMLARFPEGEVAVGGSFDGPSRGSLGEFIQQKLKTKMNPAVYVAALLIEEGYADAPRRGYIQFRSKARRHAGIRSI
jgi:excisionase family DNA binding protein